MHIKDNMHIKNANTYTGILTNNINTHNMHVYIYMQPYINIHKHI